MSLKECLNDYVKQFNYNDIEYVKTDISNDDALEFLLNEIPLIDIPDKDIERTYYFRYWVFRKHIKKTPFGYIITEFLPDVNWAGAYNSINCATPFHIAEGRWLKNSSCYIEEYIDFYLNGIGDAFSYSMPFVSAIYNYTQISGNTDFLAERYGIIREWFEKRLLKTKRYSGLYYSVDDRDGMEFSISGSGMRPTINSYIYADAIALSDIAKTINNYYDAKRYSEFAEELKSNILNFLWDGDFFITLPEFCLTSDGSVEKIVPEEKNVHELIGYIPFMYGIADKENNTAWEFLLNPKHFYTDYGLTTADQSHKKFMEKHNHECLWNGPIWPYATSQVLTALAKVKQDDKDFFICNNDYLSLLRSYAICHRRKLKDGITIDWVDENISPIDGSWLSRNILEKWGFPDEKGGIERGKDYNHSLFCDLVLSGLLGISVSEGKISVNSLIPDDWDYFRVENLNVQGKTYCITYTKNNGVTIEEN